MTARQDRFRVSYAVAMAKPPKSSKPDFPWLRVVRLIAFLDRWRDGPAIQKHLGVTRFMAHHYLGQLRELGVLEEQDRRSGTEGRAKEYRVQGFSRVVEAIEKL